MTFGKYWLRKHFSQLFKYMGKSCYEKSAVKERGAFYFMFSLGKYQKKKKVAGVARKQSHLQLFPSFAIHLPDIYIIVDGRMRSW